MPWPSAKFTVMKYHSLPPRAIIAAAVELPVAQASLTHWMVFGEQALPVRSKLAVDDARNVMRESRSSELMVRPTAEFGTSTTGVDAIDIEPFAHDRGSHVGLVLVIGVDDLDLDTLAAAVEILRRHPRGFHRTHAVGVLEDAGRCR
jgi:hypothetical protein